VDPVAFFNQTIVMEGVLKDVWRLGSKHRLVLPNELPHRARALVNGRLPLEKDLAIPRTVARHARNLVGTAAYYALAREI
jgi:hypothetical protein